LTDSDDRDPLLPAPAGPHPAPDEIYRARTDPAWNRSAAILTHAAACAACTEEMLRQEAFDEPEALDEAETEAAWERFFLEGEEEAVPSPIPGPGPVAMPAPAPHERQEDRFRTAGPIRRIGPDRRHPFRTLTLLAAAFAVCFVGLSLWRLQVSGVATPAPVSGPTPAANPPTPTPTLPPGTAPDTEPDTTRGGPAGSVAVWSPSGELSEAPHEFLFPQEAAGPRRVTVYDAARSYFWTSPPSSSGSIPFPESERRKLTPGVDYFWTLLGDEATPSEGAALRFRLEASAGTAGRPGPG
jgi:hypothetical protein